MMRRGGPVMNRQERAWRPGTGRPGMAGERGQSLIIALILLIVAAVLVMGSIRFYQQGARYSAAHAEIIQERYLAEAGIQLALHKLNTDEAFSTMIQNLDSGKRNPFDSSAQPGTISWANGNITVVIEPYE